MMLTLTRLYKMHGAILGSLECDINAWATLEQQWNANIPSESCIPLGLYDLEPHDSERFGKTFAMVGHTVSHYPKPGYPRSACIIHAGNFVQDTRGCVLIGKYIEPGSHTLRHSREAMDELREALGEGSHRLLISGAKG